MRLNEEQFEMIEEFFELIPNVDQDLEFAMDKVRQLISEDILELNAYEQGELAFEILQAMENVWGLIPDAETQSDLEEYYEDVMRDLEAISTHSNDDCPSECDGPDEEYSEDDEEEEDEWD